MGHQAAWNSLDRWYGWSKNEQVQMVEGWQGWKLERQTDSEDNICSSSSHTSRQVDGWEKGSVVLSSGTLPREEKLRKMSNFSVRSTCTWLTAVLAQQRPCCSRGAARVVRSSGLIPSDILTTRIGFEEGLKLQMQAAPGICKGEHHDRLTQIV